MASSFLNAAGTIGRVTINERIEAGRRGRRVLARQHKSRDAQDPVPILVTGHIQPADGFGEPQAGIYAGHHDASTTAVQSQRLVLKMANRTTAAQIMITAEAMKPDRSPNPG